jgi:hypothetical protein
MLIVKLADMQYFEVKVQYEELLFDGSTHKVTEAYLIPARSHAEAEINVAKEMMAYTNGDMTISSVQRMNIAELLLNTDGERIYRAKVDFITLDEKTGLQKRKAFNMLVQSSSIDETLAALHSNLRKTISDYEVKSISETNIRDVVHIEPDEK